MQNRLIQTIVSDLKVNRFTEESECEFNQRLIYSAGAAWASQHALPPADSVPRMLGWQCARSGPPGGGPRAWPP